MKNYETTVDWMFSKLPMYQRIGRKAFKKDLTNIIDFLDVLKNPERRYPAVHVAGTNGKGSVASMLASVLIEAGYKVGLYTSPHLKDFRERIKVNGNPVRKRFVTGFINRHKAFLEAKQLSFFEMTVAMAFDYFAKNKVDIAVIETGLGGRLDSTNVIMPLLSIITNVQMDHTDLLGDTLEKIAYEKAGIIKPAVPVVIGEVEPQVMRVFEETAREQGAEILLPSEDFGRYETDLKGPYQKNNLPLVLEAVNHLRASGFSISESVLRSGLMKVKENTGFRGRWEMISDNPYILFDTAHNFDAIKLVLNELKNLDVHKKHFVLSFVKDKNVKEILGLFPQDAQYYISQSSVPRAMPKEELSALMQDAGLPYQVFDDLCSAFETAKENAGKNDLIFVGGSTFTVAELI